LAAPEEIDAETWRQVLAVMLAALIEPGSVHVSEPLAKQDSMPHLSPTTRQVPTALTALTNEVKRMKQLYNAASSMREVFHVFRARYDQWGDKEVEALQDLTTMRKIQENFRLFSSRKRKGLGEMMAHMLEVAQQDENVLHGRQKKCTQYAKVIIEAGLRKIDEVYGSAVPLQAEFTKLELAMHELGWVVHGTGDMD